MPSPIIAGLYNLFLLVTVCCQTSQDSNFRPFIPYIFDSVSEEESFPSEMQRQERDMILFDLPPVDYTVDIEVSLMDSSVLEQVKKYFQNLNLPVSTNISNVEVKISNISVTTVCLPSGDNDSCCSCEDGYAWPSEVCGDLVTCPSVSLESNQTCGYMKGMLSHKHYCEPQTKESCGMGEPIEMQMSVRLDIDFHDDLSNSSSELYKKYKADLETAFNASYRCLPGFVSAAVSGFSPGSVFVNYIVKAAAASFKQISGANKILPQFLDSVYGLNQDTFTTKVTNQTNFIVSPEDIFEGDTVRLICEINSTSENVTWYHHDQVISTHVLNLTDGKTSRSILEIANFTMENSGSYSCSFTNRNHRFHTLIYHDTKTITVSQLTITSSISDDNVICNSPEMQKNSPLLSCCIDKHLPSLTADWKISGEVNMPGVSSLRGNCTEYKLNINESLCPPEKSGTVTTYTCELQTGHGARSSENIQVRYLWAAHVTIPSKVNSVSEGHEFSITCESDVSNYDKISWKIQSGNKTAEVDCGTCVENTRNPARSVLTVKRATQKWNGTYTCTFFQRYLNSSANASINVIPLPLQQNILIDPIVASVRCKVPQTLQCCISATTREDYRVTFVVQEKEFKYAQRKNRKAFCYMYNYTETECGKEKNFTAYCKFVNSIGQEVKSRSITLNPVSDQQVSCSDRFGIGTEGGILVKPCCELNRCTNGFTQGSKTYKCSKKVWKPQRDDCLSVLMNNLLSHAESLVDDPERNKILPAYLEDLKKTMRENQTEINTSANLGAIIDVVGMASIIPAEAQHTTIENFLSIVDYIAENSTDNAWKDLNEGEGPGSSSLMKSIENFTLNLQPVNNTIPTVSVNTLQLQGIAVTENNTDYNKTFCSTKNLTVDVFIANTEVQTLTQNSTIVSVMYSKLGAILPRNKTQYVNGLLITTTVSGNRSQKIDVNMIFKKENPSLKGPQCVFWNFSLNEPRGAWDTQGCTATWEEGDHVSCSCNHLTSFSILMSPDIKGTIIEDYITYIGLAISILSLATCVIIESLVWKYVTNNTTSYMRHVCILNIATSLLIADIWFVVTASINDQQMNKGICFVATFFIHLFYLCVFFWMLSLGLILFYRLVFILHNTSKTAQKAVAFCLGYGCPFVIAVVTIAVTLPRKSYTRENVCWLNWEDSKALLAFVIPALVIVVMNLFITAVVIIKILRPTIGDRSSRQEKKSLLQIGKSVAILTPLLGLTWGFGLATVVKSSNRAFHILFSLLNALQGLFILVFGTLWDKKIQEALLKRNSLSKWSSQQTKSSSLILVTPMLAMSYPFSRTFNNLCGKTGKYRVSSSEPSSASTENTSKSYSLLN